MAARDAGPDHRGNCAIRETAWRVRDTTIPGDLQARSTITAELTTLAIRSGRGIFYSDALVFPRRRPSMNSMQVQHIYPTLTGGVQAEWTLGTREVSLEVNLLTHQAEWYWLDVSSDDEEARMLDLDDRSSWAWLCDRLCQMTESDIG